MNAIDPTHDEEMELLVAAYAIHALEDDDERGRVEAHLRACAECRRALDEHRAHTAALVTPVEPPPHVWEGIADQIGGEVHSSERSARVVALEPRRWMTPAVLAAAAVLALAVLSAALLIDRDDTPTTAQVAAAVIDSGDARVVPLIDESGNEVGQVGVLSDGTAAVVVGEAFPPPDGVYQLWAVTDEAISLGLLGDDGVIIARLAGDPGQLVITAEPPGGSVVARGPAVASAMLA